MYIPNVDKIKEASETLKNVSEVTPLSPSFTYSAKYNANVFFKREDLQVVRSYKIRGAYNKISSLTTEEKQKGVICASAGNHAQGVALSCAILKIKGTVYMPATTPKQKIGQVKMFGKEYVTIQLQGDTFDDSYELAKAESKQNQKIFIHPFDDEKVIEGQATVGLEILQQTKHPIDYVFLPIGGGGLAAGVSSIFHLMSPATKIIGVEPLGAASMKTSLDNGINTKLDTIDKFIDGAAVKRVGDRNFVICKEFLHDVIVIPEGHVCQVILDTYNNDAIVLEPAGALSIAALEQYKQHISGKNVICILSGSNNDITRTAEIEERALLYANLKHYFIVRFPQRAGALKQFVAEILGPEDDITHFQYTKKHNRENGPAVIGIELKDSKDFQPLVDRMKAHNFFGEYLNNKPDLFQFLT